MTEILFARLDEIQPLNANLTGLATLDATVGLLAQTGIATFTKRVLTAGVAMGVTNGDGVAGNPTVALTDAELVAIAGLVSAADKLPYFTGVGAAALADFSVFARTLVDDLTQAAMQTTLGLVPGTNVQAFDSDLAALAANVTAGLWASTAVGSGAARSLTAPAAGITIANPAGTAGNPTFALANDLAALEGLASTGIARRTGTDAWSVGTAVALSEMATQAAWSFLVNNTASAAVPTAVDIASFTLKATPVNTDLIVISDQAASGALKRVSLGSLPSTAGVTSIATNTGAFTLGAGLTNTVNVLQADATYFPTYINGLTLSNDGGTPNTVLDIAAGAASDAANGILIKLGTFTKSTGGAWASGTGSNGMGNGLTIAASTWYHVILANNAGVPDIYFDTSATGANRPAGISDTKVRRIGSFKTNGSSQIIAFTQVGRTIYWTVPVKDVTGNAIGTTPTLLTLTSPLGVVVIANIGGWAFKASNSSTAWFSPAFVSNQVPAYGGFANVYDSSAGVGAGAILAIPTNTSSQVKATGSAVGVTVDVTTFGWTEL